MKKYLRQLVLSIITRLARCRVSPRTKIIGITGSVGKTTAKEAIVKILTSKFQIHANQKSFNSEFGIPLTILEEESGFSSGLRWLGILMRSIYKSFRQLEVDYLILELGVDRPGNMSELLQIVEPTIGVIVAVKPVHLATGQFADLTEIAREKGLLVAKLPATGVAILNQDDTLVRELPTLAKRVTFGQTAGATVQATEISENLAGLHALIHAGGETSRLTVPILGKHNLTALLAAIAVGLETGIRLEDCCQVLRDFHLPPGRLNLLAGIHNSRIIDGSYNSSPTSCLAALQTLAELETTGRKIALLGQMNELGEQSSDFHKKIGQAAADIADEIIGVFGDAKYFIAAAEQRKLPTRFFETAEAAGTYLADTLTEQDLVLAKGSQNKVRLEKAIKKILADPADERLLCRQEIYWQKN